jgi:hypothetical protein
MTKNVERFVDIEHKYIRGNLASVASDIAFVASAGKIHLQWVLKEIMFNYDMAAYRYVNAQSSSISPCIYWDVLDLRNISEVDTSPGMIGLRGTVHCGQLRDE